MRDELLTIPQAARHQGRQVRAIERWISEEGLPVIRYGHNVAFVRLSELRACRHRIEAKRQREASRDD